MKEWFIKTFMKRQAVRLYIATPDRRLKEFWAIPKGNQVTIKGIGTFIITKDATYLSSKNVPTFVFNTEHPEPFNLETSVVSPMTPEEYNIALEARITKEIFNATKSGSLSQDTIYILIAIVIGFTGLGYYMTTKLDQIIELLSGLGIS